MSHFVNRFPHVREEIGGGDCAQIVATATATEMRGLVPKHGNVGVSWRCE